MDAALICCALSLYKDSEIKGSALILNFRISKLILVLLVLVFFWFVCFGVFFPGFVCRAFFS